MLETVYISSVGLSILASIPQLHKIIRYKTSREFEVGTWSVWLVAQAIALRYTMELGEPLLSIVNVLWVIFYTAMVGLIVYYRLRPGGLVPVVVESSQNHESIKESSNL